MWTNYHTHTSYCDGKASIREVIDSAQRQGLGSLGFSSHAPLPFERKWCMKPDELNQYLAEISSAKRSESLEIYAGLEVDFIPGSISPSTFRQKLDYVIGSVHFVDEMPDGNRWEIDGPYEEFLKGLNQIFKGNIKAGVCRYLELTRQMIRDGTPDIVGHLDKIRMQNKEKSTFNENENWYRQEIRKTLSIAREAGCIVEINTRGWYQGKITTPYPSPWVIDEISKLDIPVTLSSDAHHPDDLINHFPKAADMLLGAGIKKIRILTDGKWRDVRFDEHGIQDYKVA
jgi:histidinol-phosphatase (PHP family)